MQVDLLARCRYRGIRLRGRIRSRRYYRQPDRQGAPL